MPARTTAAPIAEAVGLQHRYVRNSLIVEELLQQLISVVIDASPFDYLLNFGGKSGDWSFPLPQFFRDLADETSV